MLHISEGDCHPLLKLFCYPRLALCEIEAGAPSEMLKYPISRFAKGG